MDKSFHLWLAPDNSSPHTSIAYERAREPCRVRRGVLSRIELSKTGNDLLT